MAFSVVDLIPFCFIAATFRNLKIATDNPFQIQNLKSKIKNGIKRRFSFLVKIKSLSAANSFVSETSLRKQISERYLIGSGIEIGALHSPLEVPAHVSICYLDRISISQLRQQYPELAKCQLVEPDIIDDGEILASISDDSLDFVIANHMIEHCQNPIFTIKNWLRVLKPGGVLYMAVPDKRHTFDCERPVTSLEHLIRDYHEGPEWSMYSHFEEYTRLVNKVPEKDVAVQAKRLADINYSIHFHVWTPTEFLELLLCCRTELHFQLEIELLQKNNDEFIVVLSKTASSKN